MSNRQSCYACDDKAVNREHVPPLAFFPSGFRSGLETVPSCELHNNANAKDVEYVRNVVTACAGINEVGLSLFNDKSRRSLDQSARLFWRSFGDIRPVLTRAGEAGLFTIDIERFNSVMKGIANALYFRDYGRRHTREWAILSSSLLHRSTIHRQPDPRRPLLDLLDLLDRAPFVTRSTCHPWVFTYAVFAPLEGPAYRFDFFSGFRVFALSLRRTTMESSGGK